MASAQTIGPYRILEPLGHGGMGVVYRARHSASERAVALKTVKVPTPRWLDGIRREIDALTRIRHPGIVRIIDHGVQHGWPWYAMDLLEGESLRRFGQRIWSPYDMPTSMRVGMTEQVSATDELPPSGEFARPEGHWAEPPSAPVSRPPGEAAPAAAGELRRALQLMRRVCATLAFLHGEGFVNCDLKPENILIVDGQPVLIDFGLTAHHPGGSGREALEAQRGMSGTLPYMSPEQIRGDFLDARSDLYSVGCMLYELVTGRTPFTGAPRTIVAQHLSSAPARPSELVADVPPELERVILRLLEKNLTDRFGFADEVAAVLAELSGDAHRLAEFPPPRPYLYRPRFVGREDVIAQLGELRERASARGPGAFVLMGGESGVGKTRVAMELTRVAPSGRMRIVTSEASALSAENVGAVGASPLQAIRPLLQAIADRCQEGGPETTERLLGGRRSVLALYEPLLAQVPAADPIAPPVPLAVEASRQRLFKYLSDTLAVFAQEQPILWVLDDLGWADELSLDFLRSLSGEYFASTPLLALGTYRSEEATETMASLSRLQHVTPLVLPRLSPGAVSAIISDMLALPDRREGFVDFVTREAEGNPFFVAEHVRTAVTERVLYRDQNNAWQLRQESEQAGAGYDSLPLPRSLRDLIDQRLRKLTPVAQQIGLVAAVIGREVDLAALHGAAGVAEDAADRAIDELLRRQVLEQSQPGRVRFAHDKLREVAYAQAPPERLREIHAKAAVTLEAMWRDAPDQNSLWGTLGHHFAAGKLPEAAARYLKLAADHARTTYANADAIRLYRDAIAQVNHIQLRLSSDGQSWQGMLAQLHEAVADVLALSGRRDDARASYGEALGLAPSGPPLVRARITRKVGKTWETQHQPQEALRQYGLSCTILGEPDPAAREEYVEWIQTRVDEMWVHYYLNQVAEMAAIAAKIRNGIESHASPTQRAAFYQRQVLIAFRRDGYAIREDTLRLARKAVDACADGAAVAEEPMAQFVYGLTLLWLHSFEEADAELSSALTIAHRAGDARLEAQCLTYLTVAARMRGLVDTARAYANRTGKVAAAAGATEYVASTQANRAWLALRDGDLEGARTPAEAALVTWRSLTAVFPFQWMALSPLLAVSLRREDLERALECANALLAPGQQSLPGTATDALALACERTSEPAAAFAALKLALGRLEAAGYS